MWKQACQTKWLKQVLQIVKWQSHSMVLASNTTAHSAPLEHMEIVFYSCWEPQDPMLGTQDLLKEAGKALKSSHLVYQPKRIFSRTSHQIPPPSTCHALDLWRAMQIQLLQVGPPSKQEGTIQIAQRVSLQTEGTGFHTEMSHTLNYRTITTRSQKMANLNLSCKKKKKKNEIVETILEPTELLKMSLTNCEIREIKIRWPKGEQQCPQLSPSAWVMESGVSTLQVQEAGGPELMHVSCSAPHPGQQPLESMERENSPAVKLDLLEVESIGCGNEHHRNVCFFKSFITRHL